MGARYEAKFYKDKASEWRWRIVCLNNGEITHASSEGYRNKTECIKNLTLIMGLTYDD
jgi:uncharacterized protein YegP (UPF0339 family)